MKTIKLILLIVGIVMAMNISAKNNTICFDAKFQATGRASIEPNEIITLTGKYDPSSISDIEISIQSINGIKDVMVGLADSIWSAQIGPFLPNQSVSIKFTVAKKLNEKESDEFRNEFETAFRSAMETITKERSIHSGYNNNDSLFSAFTGYFLNDFPTKLDSYKNQNGIPASEVLLNMLRANIFKYYKSFKDISKSREDVEKDKNNLLKMVDNSKTSTIEANLNGLMASDRIEIDTVGLVNTLDGSIKLSSMQDTLKFDRYKKMLIEKHNQIVEINKRIDADLKQLAILKVSELITSLEYGTSLSVDIHQYLGIDIVPMMYTHNDRPGDNAFGLFFTVSPYFGKIDPDEKIWQRRARDAKNKKIKTDEPGSFARCFTPTIGLALSSSDSSAVKPVVFAGVGIRINTLVRFTAGASLFMPQGTQEVKGCFTCGLGIRIDYVAEILKSFTTANYNL